MAQYMYSFVGDEFYVVTYLVRPGGDLLLGPFLPFTLEVWIMLVVSVLATVLAFSWLEIAPRMVATYKVMNEKGVLHMPEPKTKMEKFQRSLQRFLEVQLMSLEGVLDFHPEGYNPLSNAGKLLKLSYVMFMILFMATYTANLASILVSSQSKVEFSSLEDVIDSSVKICVPAVLLTKLSLLYPKLQPLAVPTGFEDVMDAMGLGVCRAGISYDAINAVKSSKHCNKVEVGSPVVTLPVSILAQPFLAQAINAAIEAQVGPGLTEQIRVKYINQYMFDQKIEPCMVNMNGTDNSKLNIVAMAGLFSLLGIVILGCILLDTWERMFPNTSGYRGGIEFKVARQRGATCYLRDDWKNTYVLRMPPGLQYPPQVDYDNPDSDDSQSDSEYGHRGQRSEPPRTMFGGAEAETTRPELVLVHIPATDLDQLHRNSGEQTVSLIGSKDSIETQDNSLITTLAPENGTDKKVTLAAGSVPDGGNDVSQLDGRRNLEGVCGLAE